VTSQSLPALVHPEWAEALEPVAPLIGEIGDFLRGELAAGHGYLPAGPDVLKAFTYPMSSVRALIVGQDPYPTPGHPIGLAFAVERHVRPVPRSLANIYRELRDDLDVVPPEHGDLTAWCEHGVLLLNRVLTERAIRVLVARGTPLVAILWGRDAQRLEPMLGSTPVVKSVHPSPLSARGGFFGSRPFSRANALLEEQGGAPIDWRLPDGGPS
jgi:uracil-DNA glycosylase